MSTETINTTVTEFDDGSKIVETTTTESEYVEGEGVSEITAEVAEAVEPVTEAAVQIAQIEAERDITIAAIQADVTTTAIEAEAEQDDSEWRQNIENRLAETNSRLEQVTEVLSTLAQSGQVEANPPENPAPESADPTPVNPETEAEPSAPEPPKRAKKSRWI